ncbi:hypothetical protein DIZ76_010486 [Coccidioides immitis]|uniref:Zn(2)-C6 fungal-type domain-containing protein n=2 Tax=Coccidioides immitis TaxID=5501 RepID=A0A0J8RA36_COCIT|nr:hypothetical protein CIRG_09055 [Coccidioides immitis RMSCC 2394]KMU81290.1 hypothetical protein CISG_02667 [Coccidioides immitis RMSCC 3703]TPX25037.1 hypothetical protein DIZ76_010486 [Coccidioides immitis]
MQQFGFATGDTSSREGHKSFVFVDEHNRHKRLKVTRACSGCRKRKIKCDSATSNIWPCAACTRLKLVCIPPNWNAQHENSLYGQDFDPLRSLIQPSNFDNLPQPASTTQNSYNLGQFQFEFCCQNLDEVQSVSNSTTRIPQPQPQPYLGHSENQIQFLTDDGSAKNSPLQQPFSYIQPSTYTNDYPPLNTEIVQPATTSVTATLSTPSPSVCSVSSSPISSRKFEPAPLKKCKELTVKCLPSIFGPLKIDENGIAPYISQQTRVESLPTPTSPCKEDDAFLSTYAEPSGSIAIPPELMPCEEEANSYFELFFDKIHPYIPVIHRSDFYRQWRSDKTAISPLLLEAIFACAAMVSENHTKGVRWLNLANKHKPAFLEAPRLSTIQALLLLLKAREFAPKNGFYYRSWQLVKTMVSMAKDLGLHEHYSNHTGDKSCGIDSAECLIKTRVWQTLLIAEVLIGAPQGLNDFGVDTETVETRTAWNVSGLDAYETERSRLYAYFVRVALSIRRFIGTYKQTSKQDDWITDPRFTVNSGLLDEWATNLPEDLQIVFPSGSTSPWLSSHYMGNLNLHFHLSVILQYRPQLATSARDTSNMWKSHMSRCYSSAKAIYHIQDAIISSCGLSGLGYMQRGIHLTVYCILTCLTVHLTALASSDVDFASDASLYFSRHMRLLERCSQKWSLPDIHAQLDSIRATLSADPTKPFELASSFVLPAATKQPDPTQKAKSLHRDGGGIAHRQDRKHTGNVTLAMPSPIQVPDKIEQVPTTPPPMVFEALSSDTAMDPSLNVYMDGIGSWDPTRLVTQWDLELSPNESLSPTSSLASIVIPNHHNIDYCFPTQLVSSSPASPFQKELPYYTYDFDHPFMSMSAQEWNKEFAHVYTPQGLKRKWEGTDTFLEESYAARNM